MKGTIRMTNEKTKFSTSIANLVACIVALQSCMLISTNVQCNTLKNELKEIKRQQEIITQDISSKSYTVPAYIPTYKITTMVETKMSQADVQSKVNVKSDNNKYSIPTCDTSFKAYMDYRCITDDTTKQWEIQQNAWTDNDGFRRIGNDYIVAMGTYYSEECGERFRITFESGSEITVTIGDIKQDIHTDYLNQYTPVYDENGIFFSGNVLEFIVDTDVLSEMSQVLGTVGHHDYLNGNIKSIERIEE